MKLYDWQHAPNPRRVRIFLAEKGLEIPIVEVGAPEGAVLSDEFLAHYPQRIVPMLELDDGVCIGESVAICRYLEALHPEPPLFGIDPEDRAIVEMWERAAEFEGLHAFAEVFRNSHPLFAGRGLPGYEARIEQIPELIERGKLRVARFYEKFDRRLAENRFVAGERFSMADITTLCGTDFGRKVSKLEIPDTCVNFKRWHEEVSARPGAVK